MESIMVRESRAKGRDGSGKMMPRVKGGDEKFLVDQSGRDMSDVDENLDVKVHHLLYGPPILAVSRWLPPACVFRTGGDQMRRLESRDLRLGYFKLMRDAISGINQLNETIKGMVLS